MKSRATISILGLTLTTALAGCASSPAVSTAAPTVQAVATQVAPEAKVAATTVAPAAGTAAAASPVKIASVDLSPSDPRMTLTNTGPTAFDISQFRVRVGNETVVLPANTTLPPGGELVVHAAAGTSAGNDVYLGAEAAQLATALRPGASIELVSPQGDVVSRFALPGA